MNRKYIIALLIAIMLAAVACHFASGSDTPDHGDITRDRWSLS